MKKLFFGLLVAGVAFGASAFTNAKTLATVYYQTSPGVYTLSQQGGTGCEPETSNPCTITFSSTPIPAPASFNYPAGPGFVTQSESADGLYQ